MSECWHSQAEKRPTFQKLAQLLGEMVEEENPNKYLNLDVTYLHPFWDQKSLEETRESRSATSENFSSTFEIEWATINETPEDQFDVRYAIRRESTV